MVGLLNITNVIGIISIVLQLTAAYFAYKLIRITGVFRAWTLIIIVLLLMALRRITALITELTGALGFIDRFVLPLIISICLLWAMYDLLRLFKKKGVE